MALEDMIAQFGPAAVKMASQSFLEAPERRRKAELQNLQIQAGREGLETANIQQRQARTQMQQKLEDRMTANRDRSVVAGMMLYRDADDKAAGVKNVKNYFKGLAPEALGIDTPEEEQGYQQLMAAEDDDFYNMLSVMFYETDAGKAAIKESGDKSRFAAIIPSQGDREVIGFTDKQGNRFVPDAQTGRLVPAPPDTKMIKGTGRRGPKYIGSPNTREKKDAKALVKDQWPEDVPELEKEDRTLFEVAVASRARQLQKLEEMDWDDALDQAFSESMDMVKKGEVQTFLGMDWLNPDEPSTFKEPVAYTQDQPATVTTQADFDNLPSGAWFINPSDNKVMRKK